jgi:N-glycosylase/DNA lyase
MCVWNHEWQSLNVKSEELRLDTTLCSGQSFRWVKTSENEWSNVLEGKLITLKQLENDVLFKCLNEHDDIVSIKELLFSYFQLNYCLKDLFHIWNKSDVHFSKVSHRFFGLRLLRQDPIENLFSFICSSNNNIPRITKMVS